MADEIDPNSVLHDLGVDDVTDVVPHPGGWGGTILWRVQRSWSPSDLLLRVFPHGPQYLAEREAVAHRAALRGGVPVPEIIACGMSGGHPALLMTWCHGELVADHLRRTPERVYDIGVACGETLARIHSIPGPTSRDREPAGDWISWSGSFAERLRPVYESLPHEGMPAQLLHMDYHPKNVLFDGVSITAVIDWANVKVGPPPADLARSRSILRLVENHPDMTDAFIPLLGQFEQGMVDAYARIHGPNENEEFFQAWAFAVQVVDLGRKIGQPGVWITPGQFARLERECDRLIAGL